MTEAILTNTTSNKSFYFPAIGPLRNPKTQPVISIPFVNTSPDDTFLFRFLGQSEIVTFTFALWDDGTDRSNGTEAFAINTIEEQIAYLRDTIYSSEYDTEWTLQQDRYYPIAKKMVITDLSFDNEPGGTTIVTGTITLQRGKIGEI